MPTLSKTIFHLEIKSRDDLRSVPVPPNFELFQVNPPDPDLNRRFYQEVGASWNWTDRLAWTNDDWQSYLVNQRHHTFVGRLNGEEVGYFELSQQENGAVEIVYLGLLPEFIGRGLGAALLTAAVGKAWDLDGIKRVWLHTCTHDHENALKNYLARGFRLFKTEEYWNQSSRPQSRT